MNKIPKYASVIFNSFRKRGVLETFYFIVGEYWFDIRFFVNTRPCLLNENHGIIGANLSNAAPHYGSNWFVLRRVFGTLIGRGVVSPSGTHMVDFGCGAGRAMMAALYFGVAKVTGVDFSKTLCLRAEENLQKFTRQKTKRDVVWAVVHADACSFVIPHDASLFFLYNPFGRPVIDIVARNIMEHGCTIKRSLTVIYVNPVHAIVFEQLGYVTLEGSSEEAAIYATS